MKKKHIVFTIDQVASQNEIKTPVRSKSGEQIGMFENKVKFTEKIENMFANRLDLPICKDNNEFTDTYLTTEHSSMELSIPHEIDLPRLSWFVQKQGSSYITNIHTGSIGTIPNAGCLNRNTFNYRVYVNMTDQTRIWLVAECWCRTPWADGSQIISQSKNTFDASDKGLLEVEGWLVERYLDDSQCE
jgi:hypothetical protein